MRRTLAAMLAVLLAAAPAMAQWRVIEVPEAGRQMAQGRPAGVAPTPRARSAMLQDLAGALGAVHYFVVSCQGRGSQYWRERMIAVLDAEAGGDRYLRSAMIEAFNGAYRARQDAYPECSAEAREARAAAAARGLTLSEALGEAYR